jgi:hypothetical protein
MNELLPPASGLPWSRLVEAGWTLAHCHHTMLAGKRSLIAMIRKGKDVLLEQGEDDLTVFKRLEVAAKIEPRATLPPKVTPPKDPRHAELMGAWSGGFLRQFGQKYIVQGGADGMAVKRFLAAQPELTVIGIMTVAREAWEHQDANPFCTACKRSRSIASFFSAWNEIVAELQTAKPKTNGSTFRL